MYISRHRGYQKRAPVYQREKYDRNERIRAPQMMVIGSEGESLGILTREQALQRAHEAELDLVLISPNQETPVAKIVDWSKFKYLQKKKEKKQTKSVEIKEWQFKPKIAEFDILTKLKNIEKYLKKGGKVKVTVRSMRRTTFDDMQETLRKVLEFSEPFSERASEVNREGRNLSIFLKYKKQK